MATGAGWGRGGVGGLQGKALPVPTPCWGGQAQERWGQRQPETQPWGWEQILEPLETPQRSGICSGNVDVGLKGRDEAGPADSGPGQLMLWSPFSGGQQSRENGQPRVRRT